MAGSFNQPSPNKLKDDCSNDSGDNAKEHIYNIMMGRIYRREPDAHANECKQA